MTKSLTEKWKNGELTEDCYYILTKNGHIRKDRTCFYSHTDEQCFCFTSNKDIKEVLAPVPTYEEYQKLKEQLKEANEVIKHYANDENWCDYYDDDDEKMTKAIYINCDGSFEASCYLEKWGVK